jgi:hypothetical protein
MSLLNEVVKPTAAVEAAEVERTGSACTRVRYVRNAGYLGDETHTSVASRICSTKRWSKRSVWRAVDGLASPISEAGKNLLRPAFVVQPPYLDKTFVARDPPRRRLRSTLREAARKFSARSRNVHSEAIWHQWTLQEITDVQQKVREALMRR